MFKMNLFELFPKSMILIFSTIKTARTAFVNIRMSFITIFEAFRRISKVFKKLTEMKFSNDRKPNQEYNKKKTIHYKLFTNHHFQRKCSAA